jgi:hypothetical protein
MNGRTSRLARLAVLGSCAAVALVLTAPAAGAKVKTKVYSSGPIGLPIPDGAGVSEPVRTPPIRINKRGKILDVNVAVRITHPDTTQLDVSVFDNNFKGGYLFDHEPKDGAIPLSPDLGAGPGDCTGSFTVFDDQAPLAISSATNPYVGSFVPTFESAPDRILKSFKGKSLEGRYRLEVGDSTAGRIGYVNCWELIIRYDPKQEGKGLL